MRPRLEIATVLLFVALAAFHTWPLAQAPGTWSRNDNGDTLLNEWALAWVAHQVVADPLHLFDGNIFYPERRTLAFSEHLVPQGLMVAPVAWAGGSPVLAHNLALLAGLALTGWAMSRMVRLWTGNWLAGVVAGSLAAFNAHTLTRLAHLQAQHLEFLPLAVLALDRLLEAPRVRHALWLGGWFALQALTSGYFLLFTSLSLLVAAAVRPADWMGRRFPRAVACALLAALTAGAILLPFLAVYWRVRQDHGLVRTLAEVTGHSARLTDYLATGARLHWGWAGRFFHGNALFPGVVGLALFVTALATSVAWTDRRARMWLGIGLVTFCLSFGTHLPFYRFLFEVPPFDAVRAVVRFGQFALVAVAALAGFGAARLLRPLGGSRRQWLAGILLVALVNAEAWRGPLAYTPYRGQPRAFETLAGEAGAVVACIPFYWLGGEVGRHGQYMLASTSNWKPMLNGYSGFQPASFLRHVEGLDRFPSEASIEYLRANGVTHVVVDTAAFGASPLEQVDRAPGLTLWVSDGDYRIYRVLTPRGVR